MIGSGIFALVCKVAGFAGDSFPSAILRGAIVAGLSSYSYIRNSGVNRSAGGNAVLMKDAYRPRGRRLSRSLHAGVHGDR